MSKEKIFYFAYGSNMLQSQINARIPKAVILRPGQLVDYQMICNKSSSSFSAAGNIQPKPGWVTWGVVFEVTEKMLRDLDEYEVGYRCIIVSVKQASREISAYTYISDLLTNKKPSHEYGDKIIKGAEENNLPEDYKD